MTASLPSVRALLAHLIDYAGLFPPAKLEMAATVANFARYLAGNDSWMLGRLIIPVAQLDEFEQSALTALRQSAADEAGPWRISALAAPAGTTELEADLVRIKAFNHRHEDDEAGLAVVDVVEVKAGSAAAIERALDQVAGNLRPFFEIAIDADPRDLLAAASNGDCGVKVRTGGPTADAYPSPANLARFIHACAAANVPFKATAGMHHPLRHHSESANADEHGFLNVFIAAGLAQTDELSERDLAELLDERSIDAFSIDEAGIRWRGHHLRTDSIDDVRNEFAVSFGSCSFDEPRQDLRDLGLLEPISAVHAHD